MVIPPDQAMDAEDEVGFFQAVKSRLVKFDMTGTGKTNEEMETALPQVIGEALVSDKVVDIFDAAGIKKSDTSILSDECLMEM
jgi:type I restriction enzyme R subunit